MGARLRDPLGALGAVLVLAAGLLGRPIPVAAEIVSARVSVRGMTCNICSAAVERHLRRVPCVVTASVDLEKGLAEIIPRDGQRFEGRKVLKAIQAAGFSPGAIQVAARGRLVEVQGVEYLELAPGELALLTGPGGTLHPQGLPAEGRLTLISGRFADPSGDPIAGVAIVVEHAQLAAAE